MRHLTFFLIAILSFGLIALSSCEQDTNIPSDQPPHEEPLPDKDTIPENDSIPEISINTNSYIFDEEEKPIRASFFGDEGGIYGIHFTSGDIDYYDELDIAVSYISIYCNEDSFTGKTIDITNHDAELIITYTYNLTEEVFYIESGNTGSPEDNIRISQDPDNEYGFKVYMDVTFPENGKRLILNYDGVCKDFSVPVPESELTYNGEVSPLNSLVIDMTDESICRIYLSSESGITTVEDMSANNPLLISFPKEALAEPFDAVVGFSAYKNGEASISYDGQTYTYENSLGTIETSYADGVYSISFDNWSNLAGFYNGQGTVIE